MRPQPFLHELVSVLSAPTTALSGSDGQIRPGGVAGVLCADRRLLAELTVTLDGTEPEPLGHALSGASAAVFTAVARDLGDPGPDPTVLVRRTRTARPDGIGERVGVASTAHSEVRTRLVVRLGTDLAPMPAIKAGRTVPAVPPVAPADGTPGTVRWSAPDGTGAVATASPAPDGVRTGSAGTELYWDVTVPPGGEWSATVRVSAEGATAGPFRPAAASWSTPVVRSAVRDLDRLVDRSVADLAGLPMTDRAGGPDAFLAAGSPWFFTLFGRDSLWAARMLLPLGTGLAAGTLRVLARYQGTRYDERTGEAPGKIIHEVRDEHGGAVGLPPRYYGTIDATPLWVATLHDAWRWGMPDAEVADLLPPLRAALGWITAATGDSGFLRYVDTAGGGLANQGWKDSGDAVQWPDGTIATPPIALCEAQAYAYEAAVAGADLLAAVGTAADLDTVAALRAYAVELRDRFRAAFWVSDDLGAFPALALDGADRPVPVASSNLGHLLGTGLLSAAEARQVADRLAADDLSGGYGLRTLTDRVAGANPLGYHTGTVWPHDTAIAVHGLAREGYGSTAARLAGGLLAAAPSFEYRLPELFGGSALGDPVLAYPASCRPQAWAATAPVLLLSAALGLRPDVPAGTLTVRPDPAFSGWFPLTVTDLRVGGHSLAVSVDAAGTARVTTDAPLRLT